MRNRFTLIQNKEIDKPVEFVIFCAAVVHEEDMYWSSEYGWVTLDIATRFTKEEKLALHLPSDCIWIDFTSMVQSIEMSKASHPTSGFRKPQLTIVDENE